VRLLPDYPMYVITIHQRYRQIDGQTEHFNIFIAILRDALCTYVIRAVKIKRLSLTCGIKSQWILPTAHKKLVHTLYLAFPRFYLIGWQQRTVYINIYYKKTSKTWHTMKWLEQYPINSTDAIRILFAAIRHMHTACRWPTGESIKIDTKLKLRICFRTVLTEIVLKSTPLDAQCCVAFVATRRQTRTVRTTAEKRSGRSRLAGVVTSVREVQWLWPQSSRRTDAVSSVSETCVTRQTPHINHCAVKLNQQHPASRSLLPPRSHLRHTRHSTLIEHSLVRQLVSCRFKTPPFDSDIRRADWHKKILPVLTTVLVSRH